MGFVPRLVTGLEPPPEPPAAPRAPAPAGVDPEVLAEVLRVALERRRREDDDDEELAFRLELKADAAHEAVLLLRVLVVLEALLGLLLLRALLV